MKINKYKCDQCGTENDLHKDISGLKRISHLCTVTTPTKLDESVLTGASVNKALDFCSEKCLRQYFWNMGDPKL